MITFADQNRKALELDDKVDLSLLINKQRWHVILYNQEQATMSNDMAFCCLEEAYLTNNKDSYWALLLKQD